MLERVEADDAERRKRLKELEVRSFALLAHSLCLTSPQIVMRDWSDCFGPDSPCQVSPTVVFLVATLDVSRYR